jgi:hypothetical protein
MAQKEEIWYSSTGDPRPSKLINLVRLGNSRHSAIIEMDGRSFVVFSECFFLFWNVELHSFVLIYLLLVFDFIVTKTFSSR